jgi:hypothetical protein
MDAVTNSVAQEAVRTNAWTSNKNTLLNKTLFEDLMLPVQSLCSKRLTVQCMCSQSMQPVETAGTQQQGPKQAKASWRFTLCARTP